MISNLQLRRNPAADNRTFQGFCPAVLRTEHAAGDTIYSHAGERISIGSARINLYCVGSGSPTVVFDAGWGDWSPSWAVVQPRVARWTRACSFDRAGYGFSDAGPMPRTSARIADELHAALNEASIARPYVLVAHAFGSYNLRAFADRYMREVGGIVLVDADDGDVEPAKWEARDHRTFRKIIATMSVCRSSTGRPPGRCADHFFRGLPESRFSPALNATLLHEIETRTSPYDAAISEMEEMPPESVHRDRLAFEHDSALAQGSWLRLSTNARQVFDYDEGRQYLQLDQPQVVLEAIHEVLDAVPGSHG